MQTLKRSFLGVLVLLSSLLYANSDDHVDRAQRDVEELESQLLDFKNSQSDLLKKLGPKGEQLKNQIQQAIEQGNETRAQELSRELAISMAMNSSDQMGEMVGNSLKIFQQMPEIEVRAHLLKTAEGGVMEKVYKDYPKVLTFLVRALRDPLAIPQFMSILRDKSRLLLFFGLNIVLWIISLIVKKVQKHKGYGLGAHFRRWIFFTAIRLALFVFFFKVELTPLYNIASKTFL